MMATKRPQNICDGCGHTWHPRTRDLALECSRCKSPRVRINDQPITALAASSRSPQYLAKTTPSALGQREEQQSGGWGRRIVGLFLLSLVGAGGVAYYTGALDGVLRRGDVAIQPASHRGTAVPEAIPTVDEIPQSVDLGELSRAFAQNELDARTRYAGHRLQFTAPVRVAAPTDDRIFLVTPPTQSTYPLRCMLKKGQGQEAGVAQLPAGTMTTVAGILNGLHRRTLEFRDCVIIESH